MKINGNRKYYVLNGNYFSSLFKNESYPVAFQNKKANNNGWLRMRTLSIRHIEPMTNYHSADNFIYNLCNSRLKIDCIYLVKYYKIHFYNVHIKVLFKS